MRRKSTRSATKSSPEKPPESSRKSRRQTRRQKRSSSRSSSEEVPEKNLPEQLKVDVAETPPETAEGETEEQPIWKVTPSSTPSGEIQKLKFCLTRPLLSPDKIEKPSRRRRNRSGGQTDEEITTPTEKVPRKSRHRGSSGDNVEERDEESDPQEDKKGKGKSKTKHKSKSEKTPQTKDVEDNSQSEISENVQVTPQSPQAPIDNRVDNEHLSGNEIETITPAETDQRATQDNENSSDNCNKTSRTTDDDNSNNTLQRQEESNTPPPILEQHCDNTQESNDSVENFKGFESAPQLKRADSVEESVKEAVTHSEQPDEEPIEIDKQESVMNENAQVIVTDDIRQKSESVSPEPVEVPKQFDDVAMEEVVEENDETDSNKLQIDAKEDKSPSTIVCLHKSDSSSLDGTENVQPEPSSGSPAANQEENADENDLSNTPMEVEIHHYNDDSISTDAVVDSTLTPTKDSTFDITQSFSPDIREIAEVNRELQNMKNVASELLQTPTKPQVRNKWGSACVGLELMKHSLQKIDIDTIKEFCPKLYFLEENEVKMDIRERKPSHSVEKRERRGDRKVSIDFKTDDGDYKRLDTQSSINSLEMDETPEPEVDNSNIIAMNRKISIVDDTASKLKPPPSPAKNPVSEILFITNLVRPFTLKQLKELLERTGKIKENGFWTDRIKSKCYAHYETTEEAEITRNALHGVNWPIGNGKKLIIEYATAEDLETARNPAPPPPPAAPSQPTTTTIIPDPEIPTIEVPSKNNNKVEEATKVNKERQRHRSDGHVREWDIGKDNLQKARYRSRERDVRERSDRNERHKRRRTPSPTDNFIDRKEKKKEEEIPQKLMDDLFRKTKTTPSIYWLPLTPEEISTKQQQRLLRMAEHKRRMEESSRGRGDYGRGAPYRRRYD